MKEIYIICRLDEDGNATHNKAFKKEEQRLVKAYANCSIARKLIF